MRILKMIYSLHLIPIKEPLNNNEQLRSFGISPSLLTDQINFALM